MVYCDVKSMSSRIVLLGFRSILEEQILITESGSVVIAQRNSFFIPHPASTLIQPSVKFTLLSVPADQIRASFKVALFYLGYA